MNKVHALTLGTVQFGLDYGISNNNGKPSEQNVAEILDAAFNGGVHCLDTAYAYGDSENVLGNYLINSTNSFNIITKIPKIDDVEVTKDILWSYLNKSLNRLNQKTIFGLMIHDFDTFKNNKNVILDFFKEIVSLGIVLKVGVSVYSSEQALKLCEYPIINLVQLPLNVFSFNIFTDGIIDKLYDLDYSIYIRSVYLQGLFFLSNEMLDSRVPGSKSYIMKLREISLKYKHSIPEIAFKFVRDILGNKASMVIGVENKVQLKENINIFNSASLPVELIEDIKNNFSNISDQITNPVNWRNI